MSNCKCGCGTTTSGEWAPGHDQRAAHQIITEQYGTVREFVETHRRTERDEAIFRNMRDWITLNIDCETCGANPGRPCVVWSITERGESIPNPLPFDPYNVHAARRFACVEVMDGNRTNPFPF